MQRRLTVTMAGEEVTLAATFGAAEEISQKIADPLAIAKDAAAEQSLAAMGVVYDAKFKWTVKNLPVVLQIGMAAAGDKRDIKAVQELVFAHGLVESMSVAIQYITLIVTPQTDEAGKGEGERASGE